MLRAHPCLKQDDTNSFQNACTLYMCMYIAGINIIYTFLCACNYLDCVVVSVSVPNGVFQCHAQTFTAFANCKRLYPHRWNSLALHLTPENLLSLSVGVNLKLFVFLFAHSLVVFAVQSVASTWWGWRGVQSEGMLWGNKTGIVIVLFTFGWCVVYERGFSCERCVQTKCVCVASEAIYHWGMNRMVLGQWQLAYIIISLSCFKQRRCTNNQ